jgi:GntR family transcriptional regulator
MALTVETEAGVMEAIQSRLAAAQISPGQVPPGKVSPGPKYQALRSAIVGAISSGDFVPGMRLPTEAELAHVLPLSLGTIQKAYGELVKNGLVVRSRGRGSFVAPLHRQMPEPWHCRFLADDGTVLPVYPRLIGHQPAAKDPRWAQLFGKDARIVRIDRVVSINDEFEVMSRFFTPAAIAKALLRRPRDEVESANFKAILLRELGMPVTRIVQAVAAADRNACRRIGVRTRPYLVLEATAYSAQGEVVYFQELYIPPNRRKLLFDSNLRS